MKKITTLSNNPRLAWADKNIYKNKDRALGINDIKKELKDINPDIKVEKVECITFNNGFQVSKSKYYNVTLNNEVLFKLVTHPEHLFKIDVHVLHDMFEELRGANAPQMEEEEMSKFEMTPEEIKAYRIKEKMNNKNYYSTKAEIEKAIIDTLDQNTKWIEEYKITDTNSSVLVLKNIPTDKTTCISLIFDTKEEVADKILDLITWVEQK